MIEHSIEHAIEHSIVLIPFLFFTYLLMEYVEHKTGDGIRKILTGAGKVGPFAGAVAGLLPQCGMSAAASSLYAGRMITLGTLLAIYLSTSDEMLPIMISSSVPAGTIAKTLALKAGIGMLAGFLVDIILRLRRKKEEELKIHGMCEHEHCHCEDGIFKSALRHTVSIFLFVFLITILLNLGIEVLGEDSLFWEALSQPVAGPLLAGIIGLIPNCAASIVITEMYLSGTIGYGTMMAGLLVGAGVGIMVLLRVNESKKESMKIIGLLYLIGVVAGGVLNLL
ncbi:MAG: arsenic efflux protein [Lachnospiraceae bacterium]|nr:arsenic efflux protein [Lachnospiraceae bacterium]